MESHLLAYFIGIILLFGVNIYVLVQPQETYITAKQNTFINLLASCLVGYYFVFKEGYVKF